MQTILGSTGIIGKLTAKELTNYTDKIRLVSRNPKQVNGNDELVKADLTNKEQVMKAVSGSEIVYLTAGLKYNVKTWETQWPEITRNVLDACCENKSKLVFFDNVYALGPVKGWMKEDTPLNPVSRKGAVRKEINEMIMNAAGKNGIDTAIIRSADFYGCNTLSFANILVFEKLIEGKKPQWLINDNVKHSFTYAPDAAKATAMLGNTPSAYNRVWNAPTDKNVLTGKEFIRLCREASGIMNSHSVISKPMLKVIGLFNEPIRESIEMLYQNEFDYLFDSSKFEREFNLKPTTYPEGITETFKLMKIQ